MVYKRRVVEINPKDFEENQDLNKSKKRIVQLDYETGEYVGTYDSLREFAKDYGLREQAISRGLNRSECVFKKLPKLKILFMLEKDYLKLFNKEKSKFLKGE